LVKEFSKTEFDTNPLLIQLKDDIKSGAVTYKSFTTDPTQLGVISQAVLNGTDGWVIESGYPIRVEQSELMKLGLIQGMALAGAGGSSNIDPLYDTPGDPRLDGIVSLSDGRVVNVGSVTFNAGSSAITEFASHLNSIANANKEFVENELGIYTVVKQTNGTEARYMIVAGSVDGKQEYRVVNQAYVENVLIGAKPDEQ